MRAQSETLLMGEAVPRHGELRLSINHSVLAWAGVVGGGLVYHVVSREEPARWTFQRVPQRRPPSRASAVTTQVHRQTHRPRAAGHTEARGRTDWGWSVVWGGVGQPGVVGGGPREVPALCSVEFLVLLDYQVPPTYQPNTVTCDVSIRSSRPASACLRPSAAEPLLLSVADPRLRGAGAHGARLPLP